MQLCLSNQKDQQMVLTTANIPIPTIVLLCICNTTKNLVQLMVKSSMVGWLSFKILQTNSFDSEIESFNEQFAILGYFCVM